MSFPSSLMYQNMQQQPQEEEQNPIPGLRPRRTNMDLQSQWQGMPQGDVMSGASEAGPDLHKTSNGSPAMDEQSLVGGSDPTASISQTGSAYASGQANARGSQPQGMDMSMFQKPQDVANYDIHRQAEREVPDKGTSFMGRLGRFGLGMLQGGAANGIEQAWHGQRNEHNAAVDKRAGEIGTAYKLRSQDITDTEHLANAYKDYQTGNAALNKSMNPGKQHSGRTPEQLLNYIKMKIENELPIDEEEGQAVGQSPGTVLPRAFNVEQAVSQLRAQSDLGLNLNRDTARLTGMEEGQKAPGKSAPPMSAEDAKHRAELDVTGSLSPHSAPQLNPVVVQGMRAAGKDPNNPRDLQFYEARMKAIGDTTPMYLRADQIPAFGVGVANRANQYLQGQGSSPYVPSPELGGSLPDIGGPTNQPIGAMPPQVDVRPTSTSTAPSPRAVTGATVMSGHQAPVQTGAKFAPNSAAPAKLSGDSRPGIQKAAPKATKPKDKSPVAGQDKTAGEIKSAVAVLRKKLSAMSPSDPKYASTQQLIKKYEHFEGGGK